MSSGQPQDEPRTSAQHLLGLRFFDGTAAAAAAVGSPGCVVVTASPSLVKLNYDEPYRRAMQSADRLLLDSVLLARLWKIRTGVAVVKISGIQYLRSLLSSEAFRTGNVLWVVGSDRARQSAIEFLRRSAVPTSDDSFHILDRSAASGQEHAFLLLLEQRRPNHVVLALRGGGQEELGIYLRDYLLYRPTIHCVGTALAFLTGDEQPIPEWAERRQLGWLARLIAQPCMILPRLGIAVALAAMVFRYGSELPPLRTRWTDL